MLLRAATQILLQDASCMVQPCDIARACFEARIHFNTTTDNGSKHSVMAVSASCIRTGSGQIKGAVCSLPAA